VTVHWGGGGGGQEKIEAVLKVPRVCPHGGVVLGAHIIGIL
jgi:hypothetical protein